MINPSLRSKHCRASEVLCAILAAQKLFVARKATFCQRLCSQRKTLGSHARKDHSITLAFIVKFPQLLLFTDIYIRY